MMDRDRNERGARGGDGKRDVSSRGRDVGGVREDCRGRGEYVKVCVHLRGALVQGFVSGGYSFVEKRETKDGRSSGDCVIAVLFAAEEKARRVRISRERSGQST